MGSVRVRGVTKAFGATSVLRGVDLEVPAGTLVAVLGASGGGKTTLLRILAGFEHADDGTIEVDGTVMVRPGLSVPPERRGITVVPQEGALFPHLSVAANVGFGLPRRARAARVEEVLALVGLSGYAHRMPHELSGGQQQRVAVARALATRPRVVLLDEPFSALDAGLRASVRADVRAALKAAGSTALLVTHDQAEALSVADVVAVLRDGRVVQIDTPAGLYRRPVDLQVAEFVGESVVLDGRYDGHGHDGLVLTALGRLPVVGRPSLAERVRVLVRPEQLDLVAPTDGVPAEVTDRVFFGHDGLLTLRLHTGEQVQSRGREPLAAPGERVGVRVSGEVVCYPYDETAA